MEFKDRLYSIVQKPEDYRLDLLMMARALHLVALTDFIAVDIKPLFDNKAVCRLCQLALALALERNQVQHLENLEQVGKHLTQIFNEPVVCHAQAYDLTDIQWNQVLQSLIANADRLNALGGCMTRNHIINLLYPNQVDAHALPDSLF